LLIAYVFLTEIVQEILPIRCFDIADIIQDIAGLFIGLYIAGIVKPALIPFSVFRWFGKR
jgi:VanZ family protein